MAANFSLSSFVELILFIRNPIPFEVYATLGKSDENETRSKILKKTKFVCENLRTAHMPAILWFCM